MNSFQVFALLVLFDQAMSWMSLKPLTGLDVKSFNTLVILDSTKDGFSRKLNKLMVTLTIRFRMLNLVYSWISKASRPRKGHP